LEPASQCGLLRTHPLAGTDNSEK